MLLPLHTSPEDSLEMPQRPIVAVSNRASVTFLWEATAQQHCWGSSGWPVILPCSLNPFFLFYFSLFLSFIKKGTRLQPVLTSLENLEGELQKSGVVLGGGTEDSQSKAPQQQCFPTWGSVGRSLHAHTSRQDIHLYYLSLHCLTLSCVSITNYTDAEMFPP